MREKNITVKFDRLTLEHWYQLVPMDAGTSMMRKRAAAWEERNRIMARKYKRMRTVRALYHKQLPKWVAGNMGLTDREG